MRSVFSSSFPFFRRRLCYHLPSLFGVNPKSASWMAAAMSARMVGSYDSTSSAVAL